MIYLTSILGITTAAIWFPILVCQAASTDKPLSLVHIDHPYQRIEQLFSAIPSGTSLDQPQFEPTTGADVAGYLNLLGVIHIDSLNGAIKLTLSNEYNGRTKAGTKIQIDKALSLTYQPDSSVSIDCDNIVGLRVEPFRLLGWMPLKEIKVRQDTAGNTTITVTLGTFIGPVHYSKTVGLDGKLLPECLFF